MVMVEELYIIYHGTCLYVHGRTVKPNMCVVMVSFLAGTILVDIILYGKITICQEMYLDMWLCVGVFGPMSLHWLPCDVLLG